MASQHNTLPLISTRLDGLHNAPIKHILVADDNHANRLIAKTVLERDGYKVTIVVNGEDAVTAVKAQAENNHSFDLILMDILMPVMDGIKALRRIKDLPPQTNTPPIFAVTAFCSPADQHSYRMAGFDAILTKPLQHGDIETALQQFKLGLAKMANTPANKSAKNFNRISLVDDEIIAQLRNAANTERLTAIQNSFWNDVKINSQIIRAALPEALNATPCGLTVLRKSIHTIKGASASVGLLRAAQIARHLQNAPPSQIGGLLIPFFDTLWVSKSALNTALFAPAAPAAPAAPPSLIQNCVATQQNGANAQIG